MYSMLKSNPCGMSLFEKEVFADVMSYVKMRSELEWIQVGPKSTWLVD